MRAENGGKIMTDERILQKMQMQQPDALDALMKKYSRYVYNVIAYILGRAGGHEDVEELLQDTFYSVWQHAENIQSRKLKAYLCAAARNKAKSWLRSHQKMPIAPDYVEIPDPGDPLEEAAVRQETARQVQKALRQMAPRDREIFLRHYYYLQTAKTIAEYMGIPRNTVLSRLARGRKILKKTLSKEDLP